MTNPSQEPDVKDSQLKFSSNDIPFVGIIVTGLLGGVVLTLLPIAPFAPSLFFGSAVSALVHRYLGGIRSSDASITTGIGRLGGTLASLVLTTVIFNSVLEKQKVNFEVKITPENDLVFLDRYRGTPVKIGIYGENGLIRKEKIIQVNQDALEAIKRLCREGEGFCKENPQQAKFAVNPLLKEGFARICRDKTALDSYPLTVLKKGGEAAISVVVYSDLDCLPTANDDLLLIEIGQKDAERANITAGDQGLAAMTSLKMPRPKNIYLEEGIAAN
ncbi:MAG: hypothetical protein HC827_22810 [Cyanobacteria bacterium RM1_2_2]|nr:hypothetical protein [Cyanobacteria bacterium RM1_2_2]